MADDETDVLEFSLGEAGTASTSHTSTRSWTPTRR
jgi:hypothetical protein